MGSEGDDSIDRRERRRARVQAIAAYAELANTYKELLDTGQTEQAASLLPEIARLREILDDMPPD